MVLLSGPGEGFPLTSLKRFEWLDDFIDLDPTSLRPVGVVGKTPGAEHVVSVGFRTMVDVKGRLEPELAMYEMCFRPIGEIDLAHHPPTGLSTHRTP